jgi:hypothetical protein
MSIHCFSPSIMNLHSELIYSLNIVFIIHKSHNYNDFYHAISLYLIKDTNVIMNLIRGYYHFVNWAYQVIYYGTRMWLIFVLHSFSLSSFAEIMSKNNILINFTLSLLGSILLGLGLFYYSIQLYVYFSFLSYLLYHTYLILFPTFKYTIILPLFHTIYFNSSLLFLPLCLIELINLHIISFIITLYFLLFLHTLFIYYSQFSFIPIYPFFYPLYPFTFSSILIFNLFLVNLS